jgi:hypothetical protein
VVYVGKLCNVLTINKNYILLRTFLCIYLECSEYLQNI